MCPCIDGRIRKEPSGYKGINWHVSSQRWRVFLVVRNKHRSLASHRELRDALKTMQKYQEFEGLPITQALEGETFERRDL